MIQAALGGVLEAQECTDLDRVGPLFIDVIPTLELEYRPTSRGTRPRSSGTRLRARDLARRQQ
jgi:hypothetical protein